MVYREETENFCFPTLFYSREKPKVCSLGLIWLTGSTAVWFSVLADLADNLKT
jgi:hypothetical protein